MIKAWMRDLQVIFTSSLMKKQLVFGSQWLSKKDDVNIVVTGTKYLSAMKDNFTIKISNLTYYELIQLIKGQYYGIEIKAGYRTKGAETIFKGSVIYMSYQKQDAASNTVIVLAGSNLISKYGQSRMNLGLKSGINMYSALKFICKRASIKNANIDERFKTRIIRETSSVQSTVGSWLETFCSSNNFIVDSDSSYSNDLAIINPQKTNNRVIKLDTEKVILISGYPRLNSEGLSMTLLPTFNFMPMDVIVIDNSLIDLSVASNSSTEIVKTNFLDEDGKYLITQIEYSLSNRSEDYSINITAKARSLYSNISKVEGY